jgi:hypothetical protein
MPDYTPVFLPGDVITLTTSTALAGGDLVVVTGSNTVGKANADALRTFVGVALQDAAANAKVAICARDVVHLSVADGTVTAGDQVTTSGTAGRQVKTAPAVTTPTPGDVNVTRGIIGVALATATDNNPVRWMAY